MKNVILSFCFLIVVLSVVATVSYVETDSNKEATLKESVRLSVYQTMKECSDEETFRTVRLGYAGAGFSDDRILAERWKVNLRQLMQTTDEIQIRTDASDLKRGILSVSVRQSYRNWGIKRTIQTRETVIREESNNAQ